MKNDSVRRGSHPGIIARVDGGQPSTGSTDVSLLWPRSKPASTLSLLVQISVTNNRDNMFTAESSRETEHSQLINRSSTVLPRQYVQYAFMQSQNFQARTSGCLCGRWVLQRGFVTWVDGLTHFVRTTTSCTRLQKTWALQSTKSLEIEQTLKLWFLSRKNLFCEEGNNIHINERYTQALASSSQKSDYPSCQKC